MADSIASEVDGELKAADDANNRVRAHLRKVLRNVAKRRSVTLAEDIAQRAARDGYRLRR